LCKSTFEVWKSPYELCDIVTHACSLRRNSFFLTWWLNLKKIWNSRFNNFKTNLWVNLWLNGNTILKSRPFGKLKKKFKLILKKFQWLVLGEGVYSGYLFFLLLISWGCLTSPAFFFGNKPIWLVHHKKNVETMGPPQNRRLYWKNFWLPLWPSYIGEKGRTLGKTYGIKARCYWEHPWGTQWEMHYKLGVLIIGNHGEVAIGWRL
jgi:hypothetical protein